MLAWALGALILLGYLGALWWLLRRESAPVLIGILALCSLSLSLRLVYTEDFPAGLNEDEPKQVEFASNALSIRDFAGVCVQAPCVLSELFQVPLVAPLGINPWPIRLYSLVTSVLAAAAAFAAARALGLRVAASFGVGVLVAALPWSVFYGRVSIGGEMVFHELLLIAALGRLLWMDGGWSEVAIGGFGLCLLLYDYLCGRAMVGLPLLAMLLARGRRRWLCLAVLAVALIGWSPFIRENPSHALIGFSTQAMNSDFAADPLQTLVARTRNVFIALVQPIAGDWWLSASAAGVHPVLVLGLAALGALTGVRRGLFLWGGFLGGLAPAVAGMGFSPSSHRMLMAFPFIALAAGCALDVLPWRVPRVLTTIAAVAVIAVQSTLFYFSSQFWSVQTRGEFDRDLTEMHAAIPLKQHPPLILQPHAMYGLRALYDKPIEALNLDNWLPRNGPSIYMFAPWAESLRPFYENLLGPQRVRPFGKGFLVTLEDADWSWVNEHGWSYEIVCGARAWRGQIPTLILKEFGPRSFHCAHAPTHVWRGRWHGPRSAMRLWYEGRLTIDTPRGRLVEAQGIDTTVDFTFEPETDVTVTLVGRGVAHAGLVELTPAGARVPPWERVSPILSCDLNPSAPAPTPGA